MTTAYHAHAHHGAGRRRRRRPGGSIALNLTAMIDVVFLLLTYFMLTMNFTVEERAIEMTVSSEEGGETATDPFALPEQPVMIIVRSTGDGAPDYRVSTDSPAIGALQTFDELTTALLASQAVLEADQRFVISPDTSTRWEHTVAAVSAIRAGGFTRVRMAPPEETVLP